MSVLGLYLSEGVSTPAVRTCQNARQFEAQEGVIQ